MYKTNNKLYNNLTRINLRKLKKICNKIMKSKIIFKLIKTKTKMYIIK